MQPTRGSEMEGVCRTNLGCIADGPAPRTRYVWLFMKDPTQSAKAGNTRGPCDSPCWQGIIFKILAAAC